MSPRAVKVVTFVVAGTLTSVFFINFCASIFRCGCVSLWNGADARCNVHVHGVHHCPWCSGGLAASMIPYLIILAGQAAVSFWPRPLPWMLRLFAAAAVFPVVGGIVAAIYAWATGY